MAKRYVRYTQGSTPYINTIAYSANINVDLDLGGSYKLTLTGDAVLGQPTNMKLGQRIRIAVTQDATGDRQLVLDDSYWWSVDGTAPLINPAPGSTSLIHAFTFDDGTGVKLWFSVEASRLEPDTAPGLQVWFDPTVNATNGGFGVDSLTSRRNDNVLTSTGTSCPTWATASINNRPGLTFSVANNQYLRQTTNLTRYQNTFTGTHAFTAYWVTRRAATNAGIATIWAYTTASLITGIFAQHNANVFQTARNGTAQSSGLTTSTTNTLYLQVLRYDGSAWDMWQNNVAGTGTTSAVSIATPGDTFSLGAVMHGVSSQTSATVMGDFLLYDVAHTPYHRERITGFLRAKYGM